MSFGKYDSDYSALKALAFAVGVTMPDGGWDSSYSIMSSMYEYLVGTAPAEGVSFMSIVDDIQTGVETGEIVIQDNCINEIERLNELVADLQNQLKNCGEGGGGGSITPSSDPLNDLFGVIGYNDENAGILYDNINTDIQHAEDIMNNWDPTLTNRIYQFQTNHDLVYFPQVDMHNTDSTWSMFSDCANLKFVPTLDLSSCTKGFSMFQSCMNLLSVSLENTSNLQFANNMFADCQKMVKLEMGDLSNLQTAGGMFAGCVKLESFPDLSSASKLEDISYMFNSCDCLYQAPNVNISNVTNMEGTFQISGIQTAPAWNTSKVTNMSMMFYMCNSLTSIPEYDCSSVENMWDFCSYCGSLSDLGGFRGLKVSLTLKDEYCPSLTYESIMNVINKLGTANEGAYLELGNYLNDLTDDDKVIAINKGWTLN